MTDENYYRYIRNFFCRWAPIYDIASFPLFIIRDRVVDFTDARNGSKILDVATGTGKQAFAFAKKGHDVIGIDLSEDMLKIAKKNNAYPNLRFEEADATKLPFKNNCFDVSCISFALHDMPLSIGEKVIKEMVRVTKPKGIIMIIDYDLPEKKLKRFLIYHFINSFDSKYYPEFITSDFEEMIKKSGIEIKDKRSVLFGVGRVLKGINNKNKNK